MCTKGRGTNSVNPPVSRCRLARAKKVRHPTVDPLDRTEHDRDVRAQADLVRGAVHLEPLVGIDLVRAEDRAHLVVEDLGGGTGKGLEARVAQPGQVGRQVLFGATRTFEDF